MSAQAPSAIEMLRELSPKLNAALEEASRIVHGVEKFLSEQCKLNLPHYKTYLEAPDGAVKSIGYDRVGGRFRIILKATRVEDSGAAGVSAQAEPQTWFDATRADKVESFRFVPALLHELAAITESHLKSTTQSIEGIAQALSAVGRRVPASSSQKDAATNGTATPGHDMARDDNEGPPDSDLTRGDADDAPLELEIPDLDS